MTSIENIKYEYGAKEVPDLYFCNENGKVLYLDRFLHYFIVSRHTNKEGIKGWLITFSGNIGSFQDYYDLCELIDSEKIILYARGLKRNRETGEDEPLCLEIRGSIIEKAEHHFSAGGEPINFGMSCFTYLTINEIDDWNCPYYGIDENNKPYIVDANCGSIKISQLREKVNRAKTQNRIEEKRRYI